MSDTSFTGTYNVSSINEVGTDYLTTFQVRSGKTVIIRPQRLQRITVTRRHILGETETARLILPRFDAARALALGQDLIARAQAENLPIVIDIRTPDRTLFHLAMPGSAPLNDLWARRKSNTALKFQMATLHVQAQMDAKGETLAKHGLPPEDYAPNGGAVPIRVRGVGVVACLTVSGLPQVEDHKLAVRALETLLPDT